MKEKVSIVLPIYNVEKYLERCINSITKQTYTNLEIILVDDGSPDKCPEICEKWKKKDARIRVIHKQNEGLGMARNSGLDIATGKYICFFDSDDYVRTDTIEKCVKVAEEEQSEIIIYGFSDVDSKQKVVKTMIPKTKKNIYIGKEIQEKFLPDLIAPNIITGEKTDLWMSAWCSFYSMNLIKKTDWRFVSERDIISEDIYSLLDLYSHVKKVCVIKEALYFYCANETSLTHIFKKDRFEKIKIFYDACIDLSKRHAYNEDVINRLVFPYISNTLAALKLIITSTNAKEEKKEAAYKILKDSHLENVILDSRYPKESFSRKIFMKLIKYKKYALCYYILVCLNKIK